MPYRQRGTPVTLSIGRERIIAKRDQAELLSIPLARVLSVVHTTEVMDRKRSWCRFASETAGGQNGRRALNQLVLCLAGVAVLEAARSKPATSHLLHIQWEEAGAWQSAVFRLSDDDYPSVGAELRKATGRQ